MPPEDYPAPRWWAGPLHLVDCCLVSNGGVAVIVSSAEGARDRKQPPVYIWGMGQGHPGDLNRAGWDIETQTGAPLSKERAFSMAGIEIDDIDVCQLDACYTYTVPVTREDYGFCAKGEGGPVVAHGKLGPGGRAPSDRGGGPVPRRMPPAPRGPAAPWAAPPAARRSSLVPRNSPVSSGRNRSPPPAWRSTKRKCRKRNCRKRNSRCWTSWIDTQV